MYRIIPTLRVRFALAALVTALGGSTLVGCADDEDPLSVIEEGEQLPGGETTNTLMLGRNAFSRHVANILDENEPLFFTGNSFFNQGWVQGPASTVNRDGLGPVFNARSCDSCHFRDGRGHPPLEPDEMFLGLLIRLSVPGQDQHGEPLPDPNYGSQLQPFGVDEVPGEATPRVIYEEIPGTYADGTEYTLLRPTYTFEDPQYGEFHPALMFSPRVAPAMIGLGLLEAITEEDIVALADPDDVDGDGISGRPQYVWDVEANHMSLGRFGWKGDAPTIRQQSAGAFAGDIGITNPIFASTDCTDAQEACVDDGREGTPEIEPHLFDRVVAYSSLLAVPVRRNFDAENVIRGKVLFAEAGCTSCHQPSYVTGEHPTFPELSGQRIFPYTDMLLHDMGEGLADNRPLQQADGQEWQTPPLWGIGLFEAVNGHTRLLHDGRARGVAEAILWHDGEAEDAREAFRGMSAQERDDLIAFIHSL